MRPKPSPTGAQAPATRPREAGPAPHPASGPAETQGRICEPTAPAEWAPEGGLSDLAQGQRPSVFARLAAHWLAYAVQRPLAIWWWALSAWHRRQGDYQRRTLRWAFRAWRLGRSTRLCLHWLLLRRDFGLPLPRRCWAEVARLAAHPATPAGQRRATLRLLADVPVAVRLGPAGTEAPPSGGPELVSPGRPLPVAARSPLSATADGIGNTADMAALRRRFLAWLAEQLAAAPADAGLCLVGNAGRLAGSGLGARIDAHALVLRFNRWWQGPTGAEQWPQADLGQRLDIWVCSPNPPVPPPGRPAWVVVSGPDPVADLPRWPVLCQLQAQGVPVLTVPLPVWRQAVARLQAPPSAGLLMLHWLAQEAARAEPPWRGIGVAGIGVADVATAAADRARKGSVPHHLLRPGRHGRGRHRWAEEAACVAEWRQQGLRDWLADGNLRVR